MTKPKRKDISESSTHPVKIISIPCLISFSSNYPAKHKKLCEWRNDLLLWSSGTAAETPLSDPVSASRKDTPAPGNLRWSLPASGS